MEEWRPNPGAQEAFHKSSAFEVGYGGAAGGGKSESLLREALRQTPIPGYRAALFRRTYPELENSLIDRAMKIYPDHGGKSKDRGRTWMFNTADPKNPSKIIFAHLEHDWDVHKYQSAQFDVLGFDEATSFTEYQYTYMRSRVRGDNPAVHRCILLATNPGNIGHTWFKTRFIDGKEPFRKHYFKIVDGKEVSCKMTDPDGLSRVFIPAKIWDNPPLIRNNPHYLAQLKSLDELNRRMLLEGDWDVFKGQYFNEWRVERHVVKPFPIPPFWKKFLGIDYGYTAPFCALGVALDQDGNAYVYREYYETNRTAKENARAVYEQFPEGYVYAAVDPSVFAKTSVGITTAELIRHPYDDHRTLKIVAASNRRIDGWNTVREYLAEKKPVDMNGTLIPDKRPSLYVFDTCVNLIRTLPQMVYDKYNQEDLDTTLEDHACVPGDTDIAMADGTTKKIIDVSVGDTVQTMSGPKRVIDSAKTGIQMPIYEIHTRLGKFKATGNHRVYTQNGLVRVDSLRYTDEVIHLTQCVWTQKSSTDRSTISTGSTLSHSGVVKTEKSDCMWRFGKQLMAKCQEVSMSIIGIMMERITRLKIWNCFLAPSICATTDGRTGAIQSTGKDSSSIWAKSGSQRKYGTLQTLVSNGIDRMQRISGTKGSGLQNLVRFAERNTKRHSQLEANFVTKIVKPEHCEPEDVYNITVEDAHQYFANGHLVKNCDTLRYILQTMRQKKSVPTPDKPVVPERYAKKFKQKSATSNPLDLYVRTPR